MKKLFIAPVQTGIAISVAILLLSFTQNKSFFEQVFTILKSNINQQIHLIIEGIPTQQKLNEPVSFNFNPGATCLALANDAIAGNVWEDLNYDGDKSTESTIIGVQGIKVSLYNSKNEKVDSANTGIDGDYLFSSLLDIIYRVEFVIPSKMKSYTSATQSGANNGTSVQFIAPGNCADLGLAYPAQYCDTNAYLITPCFVSGEPSLGGSSGIGDVLVSYPNTAGAQKSDVKPLVLNKDMGTTWGIAFAKTSQDIYAGSMMKRHAGFGPLGLGGINYVDYRQS